MSNVKDLTNLMDVLLNSEKIYGLMVLGEAGIGKSFSVMTYLDTKKITPIVMKTYTTPLSLYKWLWEQRDEDLIVMDDVDGIWENDQSAAIMKSALWEDGDERRIEWHSTSKVLSNEGIPFGFLFNSNIIFICNRTRDNPHVNAVLSRVLHYKFNYTREEKIEEMKRIARTKDAFTLTTKERLEVVSMIDKHASIFDFRTLVQGFIIREYSKKHGGDWNRIFLTVLTGDANKEMKIVYDLSKSDMTSKEQVKEFVKQTNMSRRTYFYMRKKLRDSGCL